MSTEQVENPANIVLQVVSKTIEQWKANNPPAKIEKDTLKLLNKNAEEILFKLLGFDKDSWSGKWKLDHCNGRSGESAAGDYIRKHKALVVQQWLSEVELPELKDVLKKEMKDEAKRIFETEFRQAFRLNVQAHAEQKANELFAAISPELALEKYFKTINLLNNNVSSS